MAEDKGKPLLIACSFGDPRLDYLLKQKSVDMRGLGRFLRIEHKTPIVLCNIKMHDIDLLAKDIKNTKDIYVDTSELKHSMFAIEDLTEIGLEGRIVFGSFFPLFNFSSAYIHFYGGNDEIKNNILKRII